MHTSTLLMLIPFAAASFGAAATGAFFRPGPVTHRQLNKPRWRPPDWLFAPVWTVLYVSIAVSGWLVCARGRHPERRNASQRVRSATPAQRCLDTDLLRTSSTGPAMVEIVILWVSIVTTMVLFHPINAAAALLLVPYLLWVSFASALNFSIWRRNRATTAAKGAR